MAPAKAAPKVTSDPDNPRTVKLDRWPIEREKTKAFRAKVASIRRPTA